MRRSTARRLATIAVLTVWPASAPAGITSFFIPVTITQSAIDNDSRLATMQCWDIMVTTDGDWTTAGMELTLPSTASFYNHSFGSNTRPNPNLLPVAPALAFDTYISGPGDSGDPDDPNNNPP